VRITETKAITIKDIFIAATPEEHSTKQAEHPARVVNVIITAVVTFNNVWPKLTEFLQEYILFLRADRNVGHIDRFSDGSLNINPAWWSCVHNRQF